MEDLKFSLGYDVDVYIEKAVEKLKNDYYYHWADRSLFNDQLRYAIEEENGEYHYVCYTTFSKGDVEREILDAELLSSYKPVSNAEEFIDRIVSDNEHSVFYANKKTDCYTVEFEKPYLLDDGWALERYEFNRLKSGDYAAFVQAGDRMSGGSRDFFIPPQYFKGTFEEFLERYERLVPAKSFGLLKEELRKDEGLKGFLGFQE